MPKSQLVAQWRELNCIFKNKSRHILINYIYEYPKENLYRYSMYVLREMSARNYTVRSYDNFNDYFIDIDTSKAFNSGSNPFPNHHDDRYLLQCYFNLQEKYDRGQKDFSEEQYKRLENSIIDIIKKGSKI